MRANILLHPDSLMRNPCDSDVVYMEKFCKFAKDIQEILTNNLDDHFIVSPNLYYTALLGDKTILDLSGSLGRDEREIMYTILSNSSDCEDCTIDEYRLKCSYKKDEEACSTIAILNEDSRPVKDLEYIQFENYEIVYGYSSWQTFRRQILGNHPENPSNFISCAKIIFPNLFFHENCESSVTEYLECIPRRIVYYLSCLNDNFSSYKTSCGTTQANDILEGFSAKYGLDKVGSIEMRPGHKPRFTYSFTDKNGVEQSICCEPHLKINKYDSNYTTSLTERIKFFNARIYFHFGQSDIHGGKILIGSIGPHA